MSENGSQTVARAFGVLDAIVDAGGRAGITHIATSTGLAESTVHRLVKTLVQLGCLRQQPDRRYALASRLVHFGVAATSRIGTEAEPILQRLVDELGESANLAILGGDRAEYIAQSPSLHAMRMFTEVGRRVDLHCTGVGKAILSALPHDVAERMIARTGLTPRTSHSITDVDQLFADLAEGEQRGYCLDEEEQELGVRCVAVPIPVSDTIVLAVSISGPTQRMNQTLISLAVPQLQAAAEAIRGIFSD